MKGVDSVQGEYKWHLWMSCQYGEEMQGEAVVVEKVVEEVDLVTKKW
jgi:hypothetical protein